jgi:hypothetical protein
MPLAALSLALAAQLVAAQAAQPTSHPERFDLKCAGHDELTSYVAIAGSPTPTRVSVTRPWTSTYHVDLARNLWCQDKCQEAYAPALAKPDLLVLVETDTAGARRRTVFEAQDGTLLSLEAAGHAVTPVRARCTLAPSSGDPGKATLRGAPLDPRAKPYPAAYPAD